MSNLTFEDVAKASQASKRMEGKDVAGKLRLTLVPTEIIRAIAKVREYGSTKYASDQNWKTVPVQHYRDAMFRHLLAYLEDPMDVDKESGLPHIYHLATNVAFLIEMENREKG